MAAYANLSSAHFTPSACRFRRKAPEGHTTYRRSFEMANIKSQKKRIVTNEKSRQRNRACKSELKTAVRAAREAVAAGDATAAYAKALYACRLLD